MLRLLEQRKWVPSHAPAPPPHLRTERCVADEQAELLYPVFIRGREKSVAAVPNHGPVEADIGRADRKPHCHILYHLIAKASAVERHIVKRHDSDIKRLQIRK